MDQNLPQGQPAQAIPGNSQSLFSSLLPTQHYNHHQLSTSPSLSFTHPDLATATSPFDHYRPQLDSPSHQVYSNTMSSDHSSQQQQHQHPQQPDLPLRKPKRQRVSRACDSCRKKKTKCDGKTPCTHCITNAYHCLYTEPEPKPRIKKVRPSPSSALETRLQRIEAMLEIVTPLIEQHLPQLMSLTTSAIRTGNSTNSASSNGKTNNTNNLSSDSKSSSPSSSTTKKKPSASFKKLTSTSFSKEDKKHHTGKSKEDSNEQGKDCNDHDNDNNNNEDDDDEDEDDDDDEEDDDEDNDEEDDEEEDDGDDDEDTNSKNENNPDYEVKESAEKGQKEAVENDKSIINKNQPKAVKPLKSKSSPQGMIVGMPTLSSFCASKSSKAPIINTTTETNTAMWETSKEEEIPYRPVVLHFTKRDMAHHSVKAKKNDLMAITVQNSYTQLFVESAPLFFCSPNGFRWISYQMNDPTLLSKLTETYTHAQTGIREGMIRFLRKTENPIQFDKDMVFLGIYGFLRSFPIACMFSFEELDRIIFAEFGCHIPNCDTSTEYKKHHTMYMQDFKLPATFRYKGSASRRSSNGSSSGNNSSSSGNTSTTSGGNDSYTPYGVAAPTDNLMPGETLTGFNGYAEKLCIAAATSLGLLTLIAIPSSQYTNKTPDDHPHDSPFLAAIEQGFIPKDFDTSRVTYQASSEYLSSALFHLERLSFIGNSLSGIKGGTLLLFLFTCCLNFMPAIPISSILVRFAQDLGLHRKESYENLPEDEAKSCLAMWWTLYCLEKDVCLKLGRPSHIFEQDISTPIYGVPLSLQYPEIDEDLRDFSIVTKSVELYQIWDRIYVELNSPKSKSLSIKDRLTKVVAFDKELIKWKNDLPASVQPGSSTISSLLNMSFEVDASLWVLKHLLYYIHTTYYFILSGLHRHVASHPSWIYRVARVGDKKTEKGLEHFDAETVDYLLREVREDYKLGKPYVSKIKNGVRLITRNIAQEYPRLLASPDICIESARNTIKCILALHPWTYVPLWRCAFFGFNAFVTLFVNGIFTHSRKEALTDLVYMRNMIEVYDRLFDRSKEFMHQTRAHYLLNLLVDCLGTYIEHKQQRDSANKNNATPASNKKTNIPQTTNSESPLKNRPQQDKKEPATKSKVPVALPETDLSEELSSCVHVPSESNFPGHVPPLPVANIQSQYQQQQQQHLHQQQLLQTQLNQQHQLNQQEHLHQQQLHQQQLHIQNQLQQQQINSNATSLEPTLLPYSQSQQQTIHGNVHLVNPMRHTPPSLLSPSVSHNRVAMPNDLYNLQQPQFLPGYPNGQSSFSLQQQSTANSEFSPVGYNASPSQLHNPQFHPPSQPQNVSFPSSEPSSASPINALGNTGTSTTTSTPGVAAASNPGATGVDVLDYDLDSEFYNSLFMGPATWANLDSVYNSVFGLNTNTFGIGSGGDDSNVPYSQEGNIDMGSNGWTASPANEFTPGAPDSGNGPLNRTPTSTTTTPSTMPGK